MAKTFLTMFFPLTLVIIFIVFIISPEINGQNDRTCYDCIHDPWDFTCHDDPGNVQGGTVTCPSTWWCQIERREYAEEPGRLHYLVRSCQPTYKNYIDTNSQWITFYTSCNTDRCNSGRGFNPGSEGTVTTPTEGPIKTTPSSGLSMIVSGPQMLLMNGLLLLGFVISSLLNDAFKLFHSTH